MLSFKQYFSLFFSIIFLMGLGDGLVIWAGHPVPYERRMIEHYVGVAFYAGIYMYYLPRFFAARAKSLIAFVGAQRQPDLVSNKTGQPL